MAGIPTTRDLLLIGGDHDGELLHLQDGIPAVSMPKKSRSGVLAGFPLTKHEEAVSWEEEVYHRQTFADADGARIDVMICAGVTSPFARLVAGYGRAVDADRYRCLREQNWHDSHLCVVTNPRATVKLGTDCPSGPRLDEALDRLRYGVTPGATEN